MPLTHRYTFGPKTPHRRVRRLLASCAKLMAEAAAAIRQGSKFPNQWQKIANRLDVKAKRLRRATRANDTEENKG